MSLWDLSPRSRPFAVAICISCAKPSNLCPPAENRDFPEQNPPVNRFRPSILRIQRARNIRTSANDANDH